MHAIMSPTTINTMIGLTPGAVRVSRGGRVGWGHFENVPTAFGDDVGVVAAEPSVVVASGYFPDVCLDDGAGTAEGIGEDLGIGDYIWNVRAIEPGQAPGEIRCFLSNRRSNTDG